LIGGREEDSLIRIIELMFRRRQLVRRIGQSKYRFTKVAGHGRIAHRLRAKGGHKIIMDGDG
jgi:chorismate mutase